MLKCYLMKIKDDCKFFKGYIPCYYNKKYGVECEMCSHYETISTKILIIKLGSAGDVLRSTFILPLLKGKYINSEIHWLVDEKNLEFISENKNIDKIIKYNIDAILFLKIKEYDILINLEMEPGAASLSELVKADKKYGFGLTKEGKIYPINRGSYNYYEMACFDRKKRENLKSYQELIMEIIELSGEIGKPYYKLSKLDINYGKNLLKKLGINPSQKIYGLNIGSGSRWLSKRWPLANYLTLYKKLEEENKQVIILTGPDEKESSYNLKEKGYKVIGPNLTLRQFASIVYLMEKIISSDTMIVHLSLALGTKLIVLFSSTSSNEIELFGLGKKLTPKIECSCYYEKNCSCDTPCIETITVEEIKKYL